MIPNGSLVKITHDRRGRKLVFRWSPLALRWLRVSEREANDALASGRATVQQPMKEA